MSRRWLNERLPPPAQLRRQLGLHMTQANAVRGPVPKALRAIARLFENPALWHLNRRSVAGAVAVGLFVGWLPLPGQMFVAALLAAWLRVHVPLSVVMVWFTNPLTLAPLGYVAWRVGSMVLGTPGPSERLASSGQLSSLLARIDELWPVLLTGSLFCAALSAVLGFGATLLVWRIATVRRWRQRRRAPADANADDPADRRS